jgi:D-beta-D-heptose 7-phosphate kinase/D-beta-D-heptose 1-phosphate adenosyltransferase
LPCVAPLKASGKTIVFTNGCFDLIHVGHLRYLQAARALGDVLIVAINGDESLRRLKGPSRPILPVDQRLKVLAGFGCVDFVLAFDDDTPHRLLRAIRPDVLVKGANYSVDGVVGREVVEEYGGRVLTVALTENRSTTDLVGRIRNASAR